MTKSFLLAAILLMIVPAALLRGQKSEESSFDQNQRDQYPANKYQRLEIINQHGPVFVSAWDRDSIAIEVLISVAAPQEEMAQEVLNKINIQSTQKKGTLIYRTLIGDDFFFNYPFTIKYHVSVPAQTDIKVQNRFGDITLSSLTGACDINLEYGHLFHRGLESMKQLKSTLTFADASLSNIMNASFQLSNAQITIQKTGTMNISGHFCQADVAQAKTLTINTSTGRFKIGKVQNLSITGHYNYPAVEEITETGNIEITNGLVLIKKVSNHLKELTVSNTNAPLNLNLSPELHYTLNGEVENGQFRHYQVQMFKVIRDQKTISFSGNIGPIENSATILLFNKEADININQ